VVRSIIRSDVHLYSQINIRINIIVISSISILHLFDAIHIYFTRIDVARAVVPQHPLSSQFLPECMRNLGTVPVPPRACGAVRCRWAYQADFGLIGRPGCVLPIPKFSRSIDGREISKFSIASGAGKQYRREDFASWPPRCELGRTAGAVRSGYYRISRLPAGRRPGQQSSLEARHT
jgi:hypothetical protein